MKGYIQNIDLLTDAFGKFPSFHDAEVVEIFLKRKDKGKFCPMLSTLIYIQNYKTREKFLAKLIFKNVFGLKLENFNHQNVLGDLVVTDFSQEFFDEIKYDKRLLGVVGKAEVEALKYFVKFEYCFGIEAEFLCGDIFLDSVEIISYKEIENI